MVYTVTRPSGIETVAELLSWTEDQLDYISNELLEQIALELRPVARFPDKPRDGMIIHADGSNLNPGFGAGPYSYINGVWVPLRGRNTALSAYNLWVDSTTGNDSNAGTSSGAPLRLITTALSRLKAIDLGGFGATVQLLTAGAYDPFAITDPFIGGQVTISGGTPASYTITGDPAVSVTGVGSSINLSGLKLSSTTGFGAIATFGGSIFINGAMAFGACASAALYTQAGQIICQAPGGAGWTIAGGGLYHMAADLGGKIVANSQAVVTDGSTMTFNNSFVLATRGGMLWTAGSSFSLAGGTVHGKKWDATTNGIIDTGGGGINFYLGDIAGGPVATGGVYV